MHSTALFAMASNLPVMKLCVFSHELILRFMRFFLSLTQSLPLLDLCQKINPTKVKVAVAYLTRTMVYIVDKSGNKWTYEFVLNHLSGLQKLRYRGDIKKCSLVVGCVGLL